jgi:hypothetical protein
MKKLIILLLLIGLSWNAYSQLRYFLPDSNAYFSVSSFKFWFEGDTLISTKKYKKVYQQSGDTTADFKKAVYYAAVREDTLAEKIFCIQKNDGKERLIADFSLKSKDTISVYSFWPFFSAQKYFFDVSNVDSIFVKNSYRKRIKFNNESWIEGIGSTCGLFFPGYGNVVDLGWPELLCVHINDTLYYQGNGITKCYQDILTDVKEIKKSYLKITPSIATDKIYLSVSDADLLNFSYKIYNVNGELVLKGALKNNSIELYSISKGFYIINVFDNRYCSYATKFIKL